MEEMNKEEMNKDKTPILAGVFEGHIWGARPSMGYGIFLPDGICPAIPARHLVWNKTNPSVMNGEKEYLASVENAVWTKKPGTYFGGFCISSVLTYPQGKSTIHPTEKNHDLLRQLIIENSRPNQLVFDPCAGSASTLLVAGQEGRHFLGCELRKKYFNPAMKRIRFEGGYYPSLFDDSEIIEKDKEVKIQSLFEEFENGEN